MARVVLMRHWRWHPWKQVRILAGNLDATREALERQGRDVAYWRHLADLHAPGDWARNGWRDIGATHDEADNPPPATSPPQWDYPPPGMTTGPDGQAHWTRPHP
jgi:hypothetical protein